MITVMFTCHRCGVEKAKVSVRDRGKDEDVVVYVQDIMNEVGDAHSLRSPDCPERKVDLYLPFDKESGRVG